MMLENPHALRWPHLTGPPPGCLTDRVWFSVEAACLQPIVGSGTGRGGGPVRAGWLAGLFECLCVVSYWGK